MIASLENWLRTLIAGAFLVSLLLALAPEGRGRSALKFITGVWLTLLLVLPLSKLRLTEAFQQRMLSITSIEEAAEKRAEEVYSSFIRRETEEYIWNAAGRLGIGTLGVKLTLNTDAACPYPWEVTLRGAYSEAQKEALSRLLETELGIPPERQLWSSADAD